MFSAKWSSGQLEIRGLAEEGLRVFEDYIINGGGEVPTAFHFEGGFRHGEGVADTPVARTVEPEALAAEIFEHVDGAGRRAFGFRVERHASPHAGIEHQADGVFLHVINDDALGADAAVVFDDVEDEARTFQFVFQMRRVDENELIVLGGEVYL